MIIIILPILFLRYYHAVLLHNLPKMLNFLRVWMVRTLNASSNSHMEKQYTHTYRGIILGFMRACCDWMVRNKVQLLNSFVANVVPLGVVAGGV